MSETLERIIPNELGDNLTWQSHQDRYLWVSRFTKGKSVIDAACGVGYGSRVLLDRGAKEVLGIDISEDAIEYAKENYLKTGLDFQIGDLTNLKIGGKMCDIFVSFETMEHVKDTNAYLATVKKCLKSSGIFIVSVPNDVAWGNFENEYHLSSFDHGGFKAQLTEHFENVKIFYQHYLTSSTIIPADFDSKSINGEISFPGNISDIQPANLLAICSDNSIDFDTRDGLYLSSEDMVSVWDYVEHLKKEIESLKRDK